MPLASLYAGYIRRRMIFGKCGAVCARMLTKSSFTFRPWRRSVGADRFLVCDQIPISHLLRAHQMSYGLAENVGIFPPIESVFKFRQIARQVLARDGMK